MNTLARKKLAAVDVAKSNAAARAMLPPLTGTKETTMTTTTTPDTDHQAREIKLYATNTHELYAQYQEIERSTDALIDAGASEEESQAHAAEKIEPWLQQAATRYYREVGTHHYKRFSLAAIGQAAESIAEDMVDEYEYRKPYR